MALTFLPDKLSGGCNRRKQVEVSSRLFFWRIIYVYSEPFSDYVIGREK